MTTRFGLLTDLYELTMAAGYYFHGKAADLATFELSVRRMPPNRSYLIAAGLAQAIDYLQGLHYSDDDIAYLRSLPVFENVADDFFDFLRGLRFTGEVWAVPEGTVVFAGEPLLRVTAPLIEAQIAETYLLSTVTFQTLVATKAARIVDAAAGRAVVEFGTRRAHGPDAGMLAARASYIGGCIGTSNVLAGKKWKIPVYGTAAHSFVLAFPSEEEAFNRFIDLFGDKSVLLVDTYDAIQGARIAAGLKRRFRGVRLDSGDLRAQSIEVRRLLDEGGHHDTIIMASGDVDEYKIAQLLAEGARLDAFGVGTEMVTSRDAPAMNAIYKMVELRSRGETLYPAKFSEGKATYPGRKQVFRYSEGGEYQRDVVGLEDENHEGAEALLARVTAPLPALEEARVACAAGLAALPARYRRLEKPDVYGVQRSEGVEALFERARRARNEK